jgi:hypothetical protein
MFLSDITGDVSSSLHWKDIVDSHYRISLLFFRTAFNAVICLYFRVNRKKNDTRNNTSGTLFRVWCSVRKKQTVFRKKERYKPSETGTVWNKSLNTEGVCWFV